MRQIIVVGAKRTPIGSLLGQFKNLSAPQLAAYTHTTCMHDLDMQHQYINEIIMGCVLQAGIGQAPARQSAHFAKLPYSIPATTINKMCGSGMKAVMYAYDAIYANSANIVLAGGMESMSNAPYLLKKARQGYRLGHDKIFDHMYLDGLEDAYSHGKLMGCFADETAAHFNISRKAQDNFSALSMERALKAQRDNAFAAEITPIPITEKTGETLITQDEHPNATKIAKITQLKPVFTTNGTVTAASSSAIADGAASLLITNDESAAKYNFPILAQIVGHASYADAPEWFTTAPIYAIKKLLTKINWQIKDVDLFEINEAFAIVSMVAINELKISHDIVNINGGACALGHPIGASGARIIVTLIHALRKNNLKRGIAALCIGGGEACAVAIEIP